MARCSLEIYNTATGRWRTVASMVVGRGGQTATLTSDGRVLVVGGQPPDRLEPSTFAEIYDPAADRWTAAPYGDIDFAGHSATLLPDGRVLVVGSGGTFLFDPSTSSWSPSAASIERTYHAAVLLNDGTVLVAGGRVGSPPQLTSSAQIYDPLVTP